MTETIKNDPHIILFPVIDTIHWDTFKILFGHFNPHIVGFRWDMFMTWRLPKNVPRHTVDPIMSPAMPGTTTSNLLLLPLLKFNICILFDMKRRLIHNSFYQHVVCIYI